VLFCVFYCAECVFTVFSLVFLVCFACFWHGIAFFACDEKIC